MKINGVVRLASDVNLRYSQNGSAIANFSVVSSKKYKTQSGEQKEDTTFIDCTAFSRLSEICNQYLRKGSQVYIIGELKLDQWTDSQGQKRSKHGITVESMQMLGSKDNNAQPTQQPSHYARPDQPAQNTPPEIDIDEESIPF